MLDRPSDAAIRARERRARQRAGITCDLTLRVPTRRLVAAMRAANPRLPEGELGREAIETELGEIIGAYMERWLGPAKK